VRADTERFLDALRPHTVVAVDSDILIYHLEGLASYVDLTMALLTRLAEEEFRLVVSTVSVGEILAGPRLARDEAKAARAAAFLRGLPNATLADVTVPIAERAARLRALGLRMPDALVLGTVMVHGAGALVTNGPVFRRPIPDTPEVILLDDYV